MRDRRALPVAALVLYVVLVAVLLHRTGRHAPMVLFGAASVAFVVVVAIVGRARPSTRLAAALVLGGGVALQIVALTRHPTTSDDVYRYLWDARVQFAGIDPYAHTPASPALAPLRDRQLFPGGACPHPLPGGGCTLINRPTVHTVYPPAAQLSFDAARLLSGGGHGGVVPLQVLAALGVIAVAGLLVRQRLAAGAAVWPVAWWAWSPLVVVEYGNNAHIDWLAILLSLACLAAARSGRAGWAGAWLALATLTKLYPVLLAPAVLRRRPAVVVLAAAVTTGLLYLPHLLAAGGDVVGYLPGYLHEEGYSSGSRLLLLGAVLPHPLDTAAGALVLLAVAVWCLHRADPDAPERVAVVMIGAALLVTTPAYGWYAGLLLALCVLADRWEWIPVTLAPTFVYLYRAEYDHATGPATAIYAVAAGLTLLAAAGRRVIASRVTTGVVRRPAAAKSTAR